jgi:MFS family permease
MLWYASLTPSARKTFWACYAGFAFDAMDFMLLSFVIPALLSVWSMSKTQAGIITSTTLFSSAAGGLLAGILADKFGRVPILKLSITCYAVFTFLCAFTTSPAELAGVRALQGIGFGAEWTCGAVLIAEAVDPQFRGQTVGFVQSSWAIGWAVAALVSTTCLYWFPPAFAWRAVFLTGIFPVVLVAFIRRNIPESEMFLEMKSSHQTRGILKSLPYGYSTLILRGSLLALGIQGGYYTIASWMPTFLRLDRHLSIISSGLYLGLIIFGSLIGYTSSAFLTDHIGRRWNFVLFAIGSALIAVSFTHLSINNNEMLILSIPLGFFSTGIFSALGAFYSELFPTSIRATAQGFCYNFGRASAALFPMLVGLLTKSMALGDAIAIMAVAAYSIVIFAALILPETYQLDLRSLDQPNEEMS